MNILRRRSIFKLLTEEEEYKTKKLVVKLHEDENLSIRKIVKKLKELGIDYGRDKVHKITKDLQKSKKEIKEYEESTSLLHADTESNQLSTIDKELSIKAQDLIRQKDKEIESLKSELSDYNALRSLDTGIESMSHDFLINMILKHYQNKQIDLLFGILEGERNPKKAFLKFFDKILELFENIKSLKDQKASLDFNERDKQIDALKSKVKEYYQSIEDLTEENKAKDQIIEELTKRTEELTVEKRIEELESKIPNKEELLLQKDKTIEELNKELDEKKKAYEELWANFQVQFQIKTDLETKVKDLETKTSFKSSSKSKRKSKTANLRGRQTKLGEVK